MKKHPFLEKWSFDLTWVYRLERFVYKILQQIKNLSLHLNTIIIKFNEQTKANLTKYIPHFGTNADYLPWMKLDGAANQADEYQSWI